MVSKWILSYRKLAKLTHKYCSRIELVPWMHLQQGRYIFFSIKILVISSGYTTSLDQNYDHLFAAVLVPPPTVSVSEKKKKSYSEFKIILTYKALWPRLNDSLQPYTVRKLLKRVCGIKALSNPTAKANVPTKDGEKCIADSLYTIMQYIGSYQCCCCDTSNQHQEDTRWWIVSITPFLRKS